LGEITGRGVQSTEKKKKREEKEKKKKQKKRVFIVCFILLTHTRKRNPYLFNCQLATLLSESTFGKTNRKRDRNDVKGLEVYVTSSK